jgi:hypothetical protein
MVYRLGVRTKGRHDMCGGRASGRGSSYDTRFLSVVLTFYALTQLAAAAPANLTLCLHTKLNEGNLTLPAELLAAVAAIEDVNRRDCRVLGSDAPCTRLPAGKPPASQYMKPVRALDPVHEKRHLSLVDLRLYRGVSFRKQQVSHLGVWDGFCLGKGLV